MNKTDRPNDHTADDTVTALASQVLDIVMAPSRDTGSEQEAPVPYAEIVEALSDAFRADDPDMRRRAVSELLSRGVTGNEFIMSHAGDTARMLGELWATNKISFAETTIGVARLQETVRSLSARKHSALNARTSSDILLVAPEYENHLLGIFVVCEALESMGCYVHLAIGQSAEDIATLAQKQRFDMIGLTVSSNRAVSKVRGVVQKLRGGCSKLAPIVLGGSLCSDPERNRELLAETGVDHVTSCPKEALRLCRIEARPVLDTEEHGQAGALVREGSNE